MERIGYDGTIGIVNGAPDQRFWIAGKYRGQRYRGLNPEIVKRSDRPPTFFDGCAVRLENPAYLVTVGSYGKTDAKGGSFAEGA